MLPDFEKYNKFSNTIKAVLLSIAKSLPNSYYTLPT